MTKENKNPFDLIDEVSNKTSIDNKNEWKSENFFSNLIKKITKLLWLWWKKDKEANTNNTNPTNETNTTLEEDVTTKEKKAEENKKDQEDEKKNFSFDNIMSGVSDVLEKIEKKVEEKTWIDLDAPLKKREEKTSNETPATTQDWQSTPENEVNKNDGKQPSK